MLTELSTSEPPTKRENVLRRADRKKATAQRLYEVLHAHDRLHGLQSTAVAQVADALKATPRVPVIWLHFQECTCCSESFIRSSHPIVADIIPRQDLARPHGNTDGGRWSPGRRGHAQDYGRVQRQVCALCRRFSTGLAQTVYCMIGGKSSMDILHEAAENAMAVVCWGSCASNGVCSQLNQIPHKPLRFIKSSRTSKS